MTRTEAQERARKIWGPGVRVTPWLHPSGDNWWVEIPGQASVHALDAQGHVFCQHENCRLAEARLP